jgi:glutamate-1-semialdehyde 2,1-aminomutase
MAIRRRKSRMSYTVPELVLERSRTSDLRAQRVLPGGVTGVGRRSNPHTIRFRSARAQWLTDVDDNTYLDLHGGFGTAILGYGHQRVDAAVALALTDVGNFVGLPNAYELELAERLVSVIPGVDMVALCGGGGSDACYHAVRIARAHTGRSRVVKVEGGYHGWHSDVGVSTQHMPPGGDDFGADGRRPGVPNSAGSLPAVTSEVDVVEVNDQEALASVFAERGSQIAALIVEPILYSAGCITLDAEYVDLARRLCDEHGALLVFDEVMTGFRNGLGGAGAKSGVVPDLGAYGKAVANGYMLSFLGGRSDLVSLLAPTGPVYYSGTFNGHPISSIAALKTLEVLEEDKIPERLAEITDRLVTGVNRAIADAGVKAFCQGAGGVWSIYFGVSAVHTYRDVFQSDPEHIDALSEKFRLHLLARGIYMHRRHVNRCFLSGAHTDEDIDAIVEAIGSFMSENREEIGA